VFLIEPQWLRGKPQNFTQQGAIAPNITGLIADTIAEIKGSVGTETEPSVARRNQGFYLR
jgi:hypothetical protein